MDLALFQPSNHASVHSDTFNVVDIFWSLGIIVAKAISESVTFPIAFTHSFLKQMLEEQLNLEDLKEIDADYHKNLVCCLEQPLADLGMDDMTFTVEYEKLGQANPEVAELKPDAGPTSRCGHARDSHIDQLNTARGSRLHWFHKRTCSPHCSHCISDLR